MKPSKVAPRRRSWTGMVFSSGALLAFVLLGLWAFSLVRRSREVQQAFDRAGGQAVQITELLDGLTQLHQAGSAVLQSYAVGYQRIVFDKAFDQYMDKRLAPKIPWEASCEDCLKALDGAVRAHQAQAQRVFDRGEQWETLTPGHEKERVRGVVSDELFRLEQRQGVVLAAFRDLGTANRNLMTEALLNHQRNAKHLYAFAGFTLLLAMGTLAVAFLAWIQTQRSRLAERLTRTLMDVVPDGLLVWNDTQTIVKANPTACILLGQRQEELVGQPVGRWVPPEIHECLEDPTTSMGVQFDLASIERPSVPIEASVGCLRTREGNVHVGIFRDITQRIEAERRMREAQKMEAVGALAAGVVHDVKNMLAPIGLAEEILSSEPDQSPFHQKLLGQIHKSTEAATSLMNQLLRLARKENDEPPQVVNVNDCLQQTLDLIHLNLGPGIKIETHLMANPATIQGHFEHLVQAFSNLFINAGHAMQGEGILRVATGNAEKDLEIHISDTGHGMSPEVEARIFEPLFSTKGDKGTGLGLFNVKHTIEEMGGNIDVASVLGQGTDFVIRIPTAKDSEWFQSEFQNAGGVQL